MLPTKLFCHKNLTYKVNKIIFGYFLFLKIKVNDTSNLRKHLRKSYNQREFVLFTARRLYNFEITTINNEIMFYNDFQNNSPLKILSAKTKKIGHFCRFFFWAFLKSFF